MYSATSGETPQRCSRPGNTKLRSKRMVFKRLRKRGRDRPRSSLRRLNEPSLGTFKSWYKTYLFKQSFDCHWLFELVYSALSFGLGCTMALYKSSYYCRAWLRTVAAVFPDSGTPAHHKFLVCCVFILGLPTCISQILCCWLHGVVWQGDLPAIGWTVLAVLLGELEELWQTTCWNFASW